MGFEDIKKLGAELSTDERRRLIAYLVTLQDLQDANYRAKLTRKIDDKNPAHWATIEEVNERLGLTANGGL